MSKIEEEYASHVVPKELFEEIENPYDLILDIEDVIKTVEKEEKRIIKKRRRNKAAQTLFFHMTDALKEEEICYNGMLQMIDDDIIMMYDIGTVVDTNNLEEMIKLMDFLVTSYTNNTAYYAGLLDSIDMSMKGIGFVDNRNSYTHPAVKEFIEKKLIALKSAKKLEKI